MDQTRKERYNTKIVNSIEHVLSEGCKTIEAYTWSILYPSTCMYASFTLSYYRPKKKSKEVNLKESEE